jgi:hypothetical protein
MYVTSNVRRYSMSRALLTNGRNKTNWYLHGQLAKDRLLILVRSV